MIHQMGPIQQALQRAPVHRDLPSLMQCAAGGPAGIRFKMRVKLRFFGLTILIAHKVAINKLTTSAMMLTDFIITCTRPLNK
jgi:hypothetical protein